MRWLSDESYAVHCVDAGPSIKGDRGAAGRPARAEQEVVEYRPNYGDHMATKKTPQVPTSSQRGNLHAPRSPATAGVTGGQMQPVTRGSGTHGC
jgi:hypothetical protein